MRKEPPKPRRKTVETPKQPAETSAAPDVDVQRGADNDTGETFGHPIFGRAKFVTILVGRLRYRAGNERSPPIRLGLGPIAPENLLDPSQLFPLHGPGRFDLRAIDGNGLMACPAIQVDVGDENGEVTPYLIAPMTGTTAAVGSQGGAAAPGEPPRLDPQAEAWKEIARNAEQGRSNDINAFLKVIEAERASKGGGDSGAMVTFLQGQLTQRDATIAARDATIEKLREDNVKLREAAARVKGGEGSGEGALLDRLGGLLMERIGGGGKTEGAAPGDTFKVPTADELKELLKAGVIPAEMIGHAVKLYKAGGLTDDRWAVIQPVAAMAGLLT